MLCGGVGVFCVVYCEGDWCVGGGVWWVGFVGFYGWYW